MALTKLNARDVKKVARATFDYARNHAKAKTNSDNTVTVEGQMRDIILSGAKMVNTQISKGNREQVFEYLTSNNLIEVIDHNDEDNVQVIKVAATFDGATTQAAKPVDAIAHRREKAARIMHQAAPVVTNGTQVASKSKKKHTWQDREISLRAEDVELLLFLQEYGTVEDNSSVYSVIEPMLPVSRGLPGMFARLAELGLIDRLINGKRTQMVEITEKGCDLIEAENLVSMIRRDEALWCVLNGVGPNVTLDKGDFSTLTDRIGDIIMRSPTSISSLTKKMEEDGLISRKTGANEILSITLKKQSPYNRTNTLLGKRLAPASITATQSAPAVVQEQTKVTPATVTPAPIEATESRELQDAIDALISVAQAQATGPAEQQIAQIKSVLNKVKSDQMGMFQAFGTIEEILQD